jgi:hypothetical protein
MPAVKDAVGIFLSALEANGWTISKQQAIVSSGPNPTEVELRRGQERLRALVYAWTCTHEGEGRPGPNQRVQWTPNHVTSPLVPAPVPFKRGQIPIGVGWWPNDQVFFAFDVWTKRLAKWSTSIHVHLGALQKAHTTGALVEDERRWDPRIAVPAAKADDIITWTIKLLNVRREAVIKPAQSPVYQGSKATIVGKVWGNTATSYLRAGDDMVLIENPKKLLDDSVWRIDKLVEDRSTKPQTITFQCHRASRILDPAAILQQFNA